MIDGWGFSCEIALIWMLPDFTDDMSTLVQVMAWCCQATSHFLSQCWPRSLSPWWWWSWWWWRWWKWSTRLLFKIKLPSDTPSPIVPKSSLCCSSHLWCNTISGRFPDSKDYPKIWNRHCVNTAQYGKLDLSGPHRKPGDHIDGIVQERCCISNGVTSSLH